VTGAQLTASPLSTGLPPQDIAFDALTSLAVGPQPAEGTLQLTRVAPNPSAGPVTISFELGGALAGPAQLVCYDLGGRVVRTLTRARMAPGRDQWSWDGTDDQGRRVAPGLYFLELRAGGFVARGRVLALR
jgi:hypothetical protein